MMRTGLVCLALLGFGAARLPLEERLATEYERAHLQAPPFDIGLRDQIGQMGFAAALSGFRAIVADFVFIEAEGAWEQTDWARLLLLLRQATTLQPHATMFWDIAAWHMAWNASAAAMNDTTKTLASRLHNQREYFEIGRDFLQRGIKNNPDQPRLYEALARLYQQKYLDHGAASHYFAEAAQLPGAMSYDRRFSAYELSYCEGREREAYDRLRQLYDESEKERLPTLIKRLQFLEQKLGIQPERRIEDRGRGQALKS